MSGDTRVLGIQTQVLVLMRQALYLPTHLCSLASTEGVWGSGEWEPER